MTPAIALAVISATMSVISLVFIAGLNWHRVSVLEEWRVEHEAESRRAQERFVRIEVFAVQYSEIVRRLDLIDASISRVSVSRNLTHVSPLS